LKRNDYLFLPVSYREYLYQTRGEIGTLSSDTLRGYLLTGGSPVAIDRLSSEDKLSEDFITLIKDWLIGDVAQSGRNRIFLLSLIQKIYDHGASRVSYTKIAQEAGLANNSAALDYIEKLADLMVIMPCSQWDHNKDTLVARKPSKLHFINLAVAMAFHPDSIRYLHEIKNLTGRNKAAIAEWIVAQELWRRENYLNQLENKNYGPIDSIPYWASENHEIDFVTSDQRFFEVKAGPANPIEFSWFSKTFPKKNLTVISDSEFTAQAVKGVTLHQFLLSAPTELYYDEDKYRFEGETA
jgi:predicted AAA+ superfamily ATPase